MKWFPTIRNTVKFFPMKEIRSRMTFPLLGALVLEAGDIFGCHNLGRGWRVEGVFSHLMYGGWEYC